MTPQLHPSPNHEALLFQSPTTLCTAVSSSSLEIKVYTSKCTCEATGYDLDPSHLGGELIEQLRKRLVGIGEDAQRHGQLERLLEAVAQLYEVERVEAKVEQ